MLTLIYDTLQITLYNDAKGISVRRILTFVSDEQCHLERKLASPSQPQHRQVMPLKMPSTNPQLQWSSTPEKRTLYWMRGQMSKKLPFSRA